MAISKTPGDMPPSFSSGKPHYPILDGLRGVAALVVVAFHVCEAYATSHTDQIINHGYLAVDFFFLLSGFVIGYAYDDRWGRMSVADFFRRRLVRLQPMVVMGMAIGLAGYYVQSTAYWPLLGTTPGWMVGLVFVLGALMIPVPLSMDIRGWQESYPLNGPGWSLFYEYIANVLYALVVRRFPLWALALLVALSGAALLHYCLTGPNGDVIGGWSLAPEQIKLGFTRMMYPFFAGLLLFRCAKLTRIRYAFGISTVLVVLALALPRIGQPQALWQNGLYDALCILLLFPAVVYIGASGSLSSSSAKRLCRFLGDISYPIYITHYPLIYWYTGWVKENHLTLRQGWLVGLGVFAASIALAYACLRWYDAPVRTWLQTRLGKKNGATTKVVAP